MRSTWIIYIYMSYRWRLLLTRGKINPRHECWFLMDCRWLNEWAYFVEGNEGSEPPGRITTAELLDENKRPLKDLEPKVDYR